MSKLSINDQIKLELSKLQNLGKIFNVTYDDDLENIKMQNDDGIWEIQSGFPDYCDSCGKKSMYLLVLNRFPQTYQCKNCILHALQTYDESGWEDPKLPDIK